ncbi:tRNA(Ser) Um(44) 2'-O-methyltransferase [Cladophialophora chaetospira]|uniref:tRNA (uracil-O(2)-)-methyltransferase n=1 Tax=Cladophialophora chaetospira TaxID=386627 RepID=A0AA38XEF6_9EURO|nr:tRNA(Ser) Um(44) 2'-O-methyltransferase [Cladophialophora chaetospira]
MPLSTLRVDNALWETAAGYQQSCSLTSERFLQVTDVLLENPNLNSTHLFRADILYDDAHLLQTVSEKEEQCQVAASADLGREATRADNSPPPGGVASPLPVVPGALLRRQVLRRLIPRKPQVDPPLDQWCYIYRLAKSSSDPGYVVLYVPQVEDESHMPWYHPTVKALAYTYECTASGSKLSIHFLPFSRSSDALPSRLHRTFVSLLQTFLRLAKIPAPSSQGADQDEGNSTSPVLSLAPSALKDTILPQHIVQDTYTRLKRTYAQDLISRWVEKTEPSKHVFEDLSIAAFLIELWKQIYPPGTFPGFIDFACGNGVLTYLLIKEGYRGRGFDARRRTTWKVLQMEDYLDEMVCIPQPFLDHAPADLSIERLQKSGMKVHNGLFNGVFNGLPNGLFKPGTFIISNHADELTPWTPILAALAAPESPLPFLAIPCCSHAFSGAKHRYLPKDVASSVEDTASLNGTEDQAATGDLKALRAARIKAANHQDDKSMYACLTKKVVALAQEVGCDVELTLMRIPSTRNIGILGQRKRVYAAGNGTTPAVDDVSLGKEESHKTLAALQTHTLAALQTHTMTDKVERILLRECVKSGGISEAARTWIERAQKLQKGQGRGKVNLGGKPNGQTEQLNRID